MRILKKIGNFFVGIFKDKQKLFLIIAICMFVLGVMCLCYPMLAKMHNERVLANLALQGYEYTSDPYEIGVTIP